MAAIEPWVVRVLRRYPGFLEPQPAPPGIEADGVVQIRGVRPQLLIEAKRHINAAVAHQIAAWSPQQRGFEVIAVAETTTETAREILRANQVAYVDTDGNASIELPGYFVRTGSLTVDGALTAAPKKRSTSRLSGRTGLIAQVLLLDHGRDWRVKDLAAAAGVSDGLAHRTLTRLEADGLVEAHNRGPAKVRRVVQPAALLDLWTEEDTEPRQRITTAYLLATQTGPLAQIVSERLTGAAMEHAITGVAAAARVTPMLTSVAITEVRVTATATPAAALKALNARHVDQGPNLAIVQGDDDIELRLRRQAEDLWVAADTRTYLDALRDPRRGREQATAFRRTVFGF